MYERRLITTRWFAGFGVIGGTWVAVHLFHLPLAQLPLMILGVAILAYNAVLWSLVTEAGRGTLILQVILDWLSMGVFVHLTGGITSPALMFFFLHVIMVTILLPGYFPYLYVLMIMGEVNGIALLEARKILPHQPVIPGLPEGIYAIEGYVITQLTFFSMALFAVVYITGSIMKPLRQAEKERQQFIHVLTHELRSPVTGVLSLIKVMDLAGEMNTRQRDIVLRLSRRMESMLSLINELLAILANPGRKPPLEMVMIQPVLQAVIDHLRPQIDEKCQQLTVQLPEMPVVVKATPDGLNRIFTNLIGNAIKYTPENGSLWVIVTVSKNRVEITVRDIGIGIPPDALASIGREFYRAPNARQSGVVGTGLGMTLVKQLVDHFSGTLTIQSEEGKGTTVTISLQKVIAEKMGAG